MAGVIIIWTLQQDIVHAYIVFALFPLVSSSLSLANHERGHFSCDVSLPLSLYSTVEYTFGLGSKAFLCSGAVPTLLL